MISAARLLRVLASGVMLSCCFCSLSISARADAIVTQGGTTVMTYAGNAAAGAGLSWDIFHAATTVAGSSSAAGWSGTYSVATHLITVSAPLTAKIQTAYTVRIKSAANSYSAVFDIVPGIARVRMLPATVVGGGYTTGTVYLTGAGTTKTTVLLRSTSNSVTTPASITLGAGITAANFDVGSTTTAHNITATISAILGGVTVSTPLEVYAQPNLSFKPPLVYPVPSADDGIFAVDMNGDGKLDVITQGNTTDSISVILNNRP